MPPVKAWKLSDPQAPAYPDDFAVVQKAVLQRTDIVANNNKYYGIELHEAGAGGAALPYRVFTHYGRTDDLDSDPNSGQRECRYYGSLAEAQRAYQSIYREKTSAAKGYRELSLASSRIGSAKARGTSSGQIDHQTLEKAAAAQKAKRAKDEAAALQAAGGAAGPADGAAAAAASVEQPGTSASEGGPGVGSLAEASPAPAESTTEASTGPSAPPAVTPPAPSAEAPMPIAPPPTPGVADPPAATAAAPAPGPSSGGLLANVGKLLRGWFGGPAAPAAAPTTAPGMVVDIGAKKAAGKAKRAGRPAAAWVPDVAAAAAAGGEGSLHGEVASLVEYVYAEATSALTTTVAAKITAQGIETPLGILTLGQIQKGEAILQELYARFSAASEQRRKDDLVRLSGEFYTVIPHRIGRTRAAAQAAVIDSLAAFEQKQETLQLMKDMLQVNGEGNVLFHSQSWAQYQALRCAIAWLDPASDEHRAIREHVLASQVKSRKIKVSNVFTLRRSGEHEAFAAAIDNQRQLFHGSRIKNWVGILSRGILMPKIAVSLGVNRTDAGWLGNGIYFGDAACTSSFYTSAGSRGTRLMAVARVALGRMKDYTKITYGLTGPPDGYHSCHGVRAVPGRPSQFADDEYVVYSPHQQRLEYLVEFRA